MDVWVCQWHPDQDEQESSLAKNPMDLWSTVQSMINRYPNESITVVSAD